MYDYKTVDKGFTLMYANEFAKCTVSEPASLLKASDINTTIKSCLWI